MNLPSPKTPAESVVVKFEFPELEAITSATITIRVLGTATDPLVAQMLVGPHQIVGTNVLQRVSVGVNFVDYEIICIASHGSDVRELAATLKVRPAA